MTSRIQLDQLQLCTEGSLGPPGEVWGAENSACRLHFYSILSGPVVMGGLELLPEAPSDPQEALSKQRWAGTCGAGWVSSWHLAQHRAGIHKPAESWILEPSLGWC